MAATTQTVAEFTPLGGGEKWDGVVTSANGLKIVATTSAASINSGIHTSVDAGVTLSRHLNGVGFGSYTNRAPLASSADGVNLLTYQGNFGFLGSTDSGATWTNRGMGANANIVGIACSSNGTKVIAATEIGLFTSVTSGASWTARNPSGATGPNDLRWQGVASDATGVKLVAAHWNGSLWTSTDSGVNWTSRIAATGTNGVTWNLNSVSSSDTGTVLIASRRYMVGADVIGQLFTSSNSGVSWVVSLQSSNIDSGIGNNFLHPRVSGDGTKMVFANTAPLSQNLSISVNGGVSWTEVFRTARPWWDLSVSSTGGHVYGTAGTIGSSQPLLRSTDLFAGRTAAIEMSMKAGASTINAAYLGSSPLVAAYIGNTRLLTAEGTSVVNPPPPAEVAPPPAVTSTTYPMHTNIVATTFWVGELFDASLSDGSQICSTYDSQWAFHHTGANLGLTPQNAAGCPGSPWGGCDGVSTGTTYGTFTCDTQARSAASGYMPTGQPMPLENPFYLDLPYDDLNDPIAFAERGTVIPWANDVGYAGQATNENFSYMKNRWVRIMLGAKTCYAQVEDAGPSSGSLYHDKNYVFGSTNARPGNVLFGGAGMDVSPAVNSYLGFTDLNDMQSGLSWQFVEFADVPAGPWKTVITTSGVTL